MEDREYIQNIQKIVDEKAESLQKRIDCINEKTLTKLKSASFPKDKEVEVAGESFSIHDVVSKISSYYNELKTKSEPSFYKHQMINPMKSNLSRSREDAFKMSIYKECKDDITKVFDDCDKKLSFITSAFKVLSKELKSSNINENYDEECDKMKDLIIEKDNDSIMDTIESEVLIKMESVKEHNDLMKDKKLELYERCANGDITVNEREEKLMELRNKSYFEECSGTPEEVEISKSEKLSGIIVSLYEKCSKNEISIDERELLINQAKAIYLE